MMQVNRPLSDRFRALSFIFACLVVCVHIPGPNDTFSRIFIHLTDYSLSFIAVPFFFFTSGFFLASGVMSPGWYCTAVVKRVSSLVVPFVVFNVLWLVYLTYGKIFAWNNLFLFVNPFDYPCLRPTWFLRTLFTFVLISPVLFFFMRRFLSAVLFIVVCILLYAGYYLGIMHMIDPSGMVKTWHFIFYGGYLSVEGLLYFSSGIFVRLHGEFFHPSARLLNCARIVSGILICLVVAFVAGNGRDSITRLLIAPPGIFFVLTLPIRFTQLAKFGILSFPIYMLHGLFIGHVSRYISTNSIVVFLVVVSMSSCIYISMRKASPRICAFIFGGRL